LKCSRLVIQVAFFDPTLWRGSRPRTAVHLAFVALWSYQTAVYAGSVLVALR
jgi:hypothetical protein